MNLLRAAEFKVGILVLAVAALIAYMSLQVSQDPSYMGKTNEAWFLLDDAGGLVKNSALRMAGIPMGVIKDIKFQDGMARVDLSVRPDIKLYVSAAVELKSQGILGDKHVELYPGNPSDPPLPNHGQILNVKAKNNMDGVLNQVGEVASNLKEVTAVLRDSIARDGTREHILGRIVQNIEKLTKDISEITADNKGKINEIVDQMNDITSTLDVALNDDSDDGFKKVWKRTLSRVDATMKNLESITGKIDRGEGTIGKLVSDEETAEHVSNAVEGINNLIDTSQKLQTGIDISSAYFTAPGVGAEANVDILIQPGPDRFYKLGVISNPFGYVTKSQTITTGSSPSNNTQTNIYSSILQWNLQFGKVFYDLQVRAGLINNYGGFGFDYSFLHGKAMASVDFYNLQSVNVRPSLKYQVWKGFYLYGGINDALNSSQNYSPYLGAGLFMNNDDLKLLLSKMPL